MNNPKTLKRIGVALETFGMTVTGTATVQMAQWLLVTGLLIMACGRGLVELSKV